MQALGVQKVQCNRIYSKIVEDEHFRVTGAMVLPDPLTDTLVIPMHWGNKHWGCAYILLRR